MRPLLLLLVLAQLSIISSFQSMFVKNPAVTKRERDALLPLRLGEISSVPETAATLQRQKIVNVLPSLMKLTALILPAYLFSTSSSSSSRLAPAFAADVPAPAVPATPTATAEPLGPAPTNFGLKYVDYYSDSQQLVDHIRYAIQLEKGNPIISEFAQKTKDEMVDFVSYYRRFNGVSGKPSFSLIYTTVNVLAGHYTSYGTKVPVPEKRKKRLFQELKDIEKNIKKKR